MTQVDTCNLCGHRSFEPVIRKDGYDLVTCRNCGLLFVSNPPDDAERERYYSFESGYHSDLTRQAAAIALHRREADDNLRVLERRLPQGRLLDVGCSTGLFLQAARARGWPASGLEYSRDSARIAREEHGLPVDQGELHPDTYPSGSFDIITMWDVIEHVPDPKQVLAAIHATLAPGGHVVLKTPNADGLFPRISLKVAPVLDFWSHPEPPGHLYQFSVKTLSQLLRATGFEVTSVHHRRISIQYSFGNLKGWFRSAKWLAYCMAFAPLALAGPLLGMGDDITIIARKTA